MTLETEKIAELDFLTDLICTYKEFEKDDLALECYQMQMLQAFKLTTYNDDIIQKKIEICFEILRENKEILDILDFLSKKNTNLEFLKLFSSTSISTNVDYILIFQMLFAYEYFDVFFKCLSNYFKDFKNVNLNREKKYFEELLHEVTKE